MRLTCNILTPSVLIILIYKKFVVLVYILNTINSCQYHNGPSGVVSEAEWVPARDRFIWALNPCDSMAHLRKQIMVKIHNYN